MVVNWETKFSWVSTIYASAAVLILAVTTAWCRRRFKTATLWLIVAGFSFWASCGGYPGMGVIRNAGAALTGRWDTIGFLYGDEVGSAYWALTSFLPAYAGFRYPAKWIVPFALAVSQLAGLGMETLCKPFFAAD